MSAPAPPLPAGAAATKAGECVMVAVRCRPLNARETAEGRASVASVDREARQVSLSSAKPGEAQKCFTFDAIFDASATQAEVYEGCARRIVDSVMQGYNGTIFCYGQTGTGKTHTMEGAGGPGSEGAGIIPRTFGQVFDAIEHSGGGAQFLVRASFLEVCNEQIRDLLSKSPKAQLDLYEAKDGSVYVKGLNTFVVKSVEEIASVLEVGKRNRSVGATLMNQDSSRSHSVFTITVEVAEPQENGERGSIRVGKLNLVDLAGSERQSKTQASGERLKEATSINLSLSSLGNVISALVDGKSGHIPYRDSKLTRLLQDSLGGNTRTVMIANFGPADYNYEESLSTLRYANRAKNIRNQPRVNEDPKDAMLREFQAEIARLKAELAAVEGSGGAAVAAPAGATAGGADAAAAAAAQLPPEEVAAMRQQIESELCAEYSSGGVGLDQEALVKVHAEVEVQLAAQLEGVRREKERAAREAAALAQTLERQAAQVQAAASKQAAAKARNSELADKLQLLESKLLHGEAQGGLDKLAQEKEAHVRQQQAELRRQKEQEARKAQRIAKLEATAQSVEQKYNSLQEEAEAKTAALQEAWRGYQAARQEVQDTYAEFQRQRDELVDSIRELHQSLALKNLVIDAFIPQEEVQKVMRRARYDEERGAWVLDRPAGGSGAGSVVAEGRRSAAPRARPMSAAGLRRPTSNFSKLSLASGSSNPRHRPDNILVLELDLPERTTYDYSAGMGAAQIQAILDSSAPPPGPQQFFFNPATAQTTHLGPVLA